MKKTYLLGVAVAGLMLAACATKSATEAGLAPADVPEPPMIDAPAVDLALVNAALTNPERPETDVERDAMRQPGAVIEFMELQPGDTLVEMEAGGGYFTEIFSAYVGSEGKVYMQNPAAFDAFLGDAASVRMEGLTNVEYLKSDFDELGLEDASVDAVTWFQGPHELWYTPESGAQLVSNPDNAFPEIVRILKPGGTFTVIDHTAPAGSPASTGGDTHRIDPQIVRDMAMEAGLVLVAESDLYDNPDDDLTANVFDEKVRGMTDQFLMKFEKPES